MSNDLLRWLEGWYESHCDGDWEHSKGVRIETLDNPGWLIAMDMADEIVERFEPVQWDRSEHDWVRASCAASVATIACGPRSLRAALELLRGLHER